MLEVAGDRKVQQECLRGGLWIYLLIDPFGERLMAMIAWVGEARGVDLGQQGGDVFIGGSKGGLVEETAHLDLEQFAGELRIARGSWSGGGSCVTGICAGSD